MFAALTVPRLIEAVHAASTPSCNLSTLPSWRSPDDVEPADLPLAQAAQKVLASMQAVLGKTAESCRARMAAYDARIARGGGGDEVQKKRHLALMNASEVVVPRHVGDLLHPPDLERFRPRAVRVQGRKVEREGDELGVLHLGLGGLRGREGAVQVEVDESEGSGFEKLHRSEGETKVSSETKESEVEASETKASETQTSAAKTQSQNALDASAAGESVQD